MFIRFLNYVVDALYKVERQELNFYESVFEMFD